MAKIVGHEIFAAGVALEIDNEGDQRTVTVPHKVLIALGARGPVSTFLSDGTLLLRIVKAKMKVSADDPIAITLQDLTGFPR